MLFFTSGEENASISNEEIELFFNSDCIPMLHLVLVVGLYVVNWVKFCIRNCENHWVNFLKRSSEDWRSPYINLLLVSFSYINSWTDHCNTKLTSYSARNCSMSKITSVAFCRSFTQPSPRLYFRIHSLTFSQSEAHYSPSCHYFLGYSHNLLIVVFVFCQALLFTQRIAAHYTRVYVSVVYEVSFSRGDSFKPSQQCRSFQLHWQPCF